VIAVVAGLTYEDLGAIGFRIIHAADFPPSTHKKGPAPVRGLTLVTSDTSPPDPIRHSPSALLTSLRDSPQQLESVVFFL
jgi:hypothetical protein